MTNLAKNLKAILTLVEMVDKSLPARYHVGVEQSDGTRITRFLRNGPFCRTTAHKKRQKVQHGLDNGYYRDPFKVEQQ